MAKTHLRDDVKAFRQGAMAVLYQVAIVDNLPTVARKAAHDLGLSIGKLKRADVDDLELRQLAAALERAR